MRDRSFMRGTVPQVSRGPGHRPGAPSGPPNSCVNSLPRRHPGLFGDRHPRARDPPERGRALGAAVRGVHEVLSAHAVRGGRGPTHDALDPVPVDQMLACLPGEGHREALHVV